LGGAPAHPPSLHAARLSLTLSNPLRHLVPCRSGWLMRTRTPRTQTARPRLQMCAPSTWPSSWQSSKRWAWLERRGGLWCIPPCRLAWKEPPAPCRPALHNINAAHPCARAAQALGSKQQDSGTLQKDLARQQAVVEKCSKKLEVGRGVGRKGVGAWMLQLSHCQHQALAETGWHGCKHMHDSLPHRAPCAAPALLQTLQFDEAACTALEGAHEAQVLEVRQAREAVDKLSHNVAGGCTRG